MKLNKKEKVIFLLSLIISLILAIVVTYNFNLKDNYNFLFDTDTARVIADATEILADHYRANVHPLFIILVQPLVFMLTGITQNKVISLIIISSLVNAISVLLIYKTLTLINKNDKLNILLTMIYLFSFSNIVFACQIETYNFAALFLILLWYYFLKKLQEEKIEKDSLIILSILGVLSIAFTITNFVVYLIILFTLWIAKKINIKQICIVVITPLIILLCLNVTQKLIWNTPPIYETSVVKEKRSFSNNTITKDSFKNVIVNDYYNSLIGSDIKLNIGYGITYNGQNYIIEFKDIDIFNFLILTIFYILLIILLIKNIKKKAFENISLILIIGFNSCLHLIYGNTSTFLYSLHFLYSIILLFGLNLGSEDNDKFKKYIKMFLLFFLAIEMVINMKTIVEIVMYAKDIFSKSFFAAKLGFIPAVLFELFIIIIITGLVMLLVKLIKNKKTPLNIISIITVIFMILGVFITIESSALNNRLIIFNLGRESGEVKTPTKIDYLDKSFSEVFKKEINSLNKYIEEYETFKKEHDVLENSGLNYKDFYYFGLGNRRKLYYTKNKLLDLETKEVLYSFAEKEYLVVPNEYSVIIETENDDFIKIVEDEKGIHFIKNGKDEIIKGTDVKIDIHSFEKEKYSNMKKVLYGELLFNIKDSKIYPNIIVYDHVWYRDAAISIMVLEKLGNLDLVRPWIDTIDEMYDKQNSGVEETDNLGEVLYILSKATNRNEALIDKIEEEAERLAESNKSGYYPYGKTDFGNTHKYQNLWYKLGIESVGREYKFDMDKIPEDTYSAMAWWSDYEVKNKVEEEEGSIYYPYLSIATKNKTGKGVIPVNKNIYPLSWEQNASNAKYDNYSSFDKSFYDIKLSPLHSWTASEFLMYLINETDE